MKYKNRIFFFTLIAMNLVDQPAPEVKIEQGILSGKISEDGSFFEYIGIPYGTANKTNRFQAPYPPPPWEGVYKATEDYYYCPQILNGFLIGSEDCLKVNVYVPAMIRKPLPVMFFIHGGAFVLGSGGKHAFGPEFLLKHDVIIVTFNYRLGVLGFTCLGIKEAPGNAGIKDQIAALRWVKKNIAAFGGDPDNITIFGLSSGATCVSLFIASEATEGLFKKAIVQSGSALALYSLDKNPVLIASLLAKELGYDTNDPHEIYKILSETPYEKLVGLNIKRPLKMYSDTSLPYLPCVEKPFPDIEAVLTETPYNLYFNKPKNISLIYGSNGQDGIYLVNDENEKSLDAYNQRFIFGSDLEFKNKDDAASVDKLVKEYYFGKEHISMKNVLKMKDILTDLYFEMPVILESELLIANSTAPVYNYHFNYDGGRNFLKDCTKYKDVPGASHGDELFYLFDARLLPYRIGKKDQVVIDKITKMWTNFATYGDPTPPDSELLVKWTPSNKDELKFLYIEDELKMGPIPNPERHQLWKDIYSKYRRTNYTNY